MLKVNMSELIPLIKEVVDSGATFRLYPHGQSMMPTIKEGRDSVELSAPDDLKEYDIVLYRRQGEKYVLHRIVNMHGDFFDMCGDSQYIIEKNIPKNNIIAKVTGIYKGETLVNPYDAEHIEQAEKLYKKKPFQRFVGRIKTFLYPAYKLLFKRK